jgi:hypothetical protein
MYSMNLIDQHPEDRTNLDSSYNVVVDDDAGNMSALECQMQRRIASATNRHL